MKTIDLSCNRTPMNIRVIERGERYGLDDCLKHERDDPLVEFYDARYPKFNSGLGQFVARYYLSTLLERPEPKAGLILNTGSPAWTVYPDAMDVLIDQLRPAPWIVHRSPDMLRWEVFNTKNNHLGGQFYNKADAERRAAFLNGPTDAAYAAALGPCGK